MVGRPVTALTLVLSSIFHILLKPRHTCKHSDRGSAPSSSSQSLLDILIRSPHQEELRSILCLFVHQILRHLTVYSPCCPQNTHHDHTSLDLFLPFAKQNPSRWTQTSQVKMLSTTVQHPTTSSTSSWLLARQDVGKPQWRSTSLSRSVHHTSKATM